MICWKQPSLKRTRNVPIANTRQTTYKRPFIDRKERVRHASNVEETNTAKNRTLLLEHLLEQGFHIDRQDAIQHIIYTLGK